ncbi:MAG: response regulator [Treponema sp.]|jgi:two-component system response regulator YesN|nr:response regulator [Treponema sp.]
MQSVIIVDDESAIRAGIRKILSESIGHIIFSEAKNGEEALNLIRERNPDLIITDIRMPKMDGIRLMSAIAEEKGGTRPRIIVLSGYDDFSYAQKAITYGAVSYILKPIDRTELISTVSKALGAAEENRRILVERYVREFLEEGRHYKDRYPLKISPEEPVYLGFVFSPSGGNISPVVDAWAGKWDSLFFTIIQKESGVLLLMGEHEKNRLKDTVDFGGEGICAALSGKCISFLGLAEARRQTRIAMWNYMLLGKPGFYAYLKPARPLDCSRIREGLQKLAGIMGIVEPDVIKRSLDEFFLLETIPEENRGEYFHFLSSLFFSELTSVYWDYINRDSYLTSKRSMLETPERCRDIGEWKKNFFDFIIYLHVTIGKERPHHALVRKALPWLKRHFTEDITMAMVANQVSANYTWFSEKFREHTGFRFNEYLNRLRIGKAKELLETGRYLIYEVAEYSGYRDVKYFQKVFKEITGLSPGEWRRMKGKA